MISAFPKRCIAALRCTLDGSTLRSEGTGERDDAITSGHLTCTTCHTKFPIENGILNMLIGKSLDEESRHEQELRDQDAGSEKLPWSERYEADHVNAEMIPHMSALSLPPGATILELGCGEGKYTMPMLEKCGMLIAVDFSGKTLRVLQKKLPASARIGLVMGDITTLRAGVGYFDRILSTLVSNLPTPEHRRAMYTMCARSLKPDGRFVFGTHYYGIRQKLARQGQAGRYYDGGIFRYLFTIDKLE
jgi:SAM-dependent methyltransferase